MKALILNSGLGSRMGDATKTAPKCMSRLKDGVTILSNQIDLLYKKGITDIVITTGAHSEVLREYLSEKYPQSTFTFVHNDVYKTTNYIYSIYLAKEFLQDDLVMMHGDLVFTYDVLDNITKQKDSSVVVDSTLPLPEKDFKAVVKDGVVKKVGISFFDDAFACQPLYKLNKSDWLAWLDSICNFCENDNTGVYAENALNEITDSINILPFDVKGELCMEVDTLEDLNNITSIINKEE